MSPMTSPTAATSDMKAVCAVQKGPFFNMPPELRNIIYSYVSEIKKDHFGEDERVVINDMKIPGFFFTCRQALEEGIGIFGASRRRLTFDISIERLATSSKRFAWSHNRNWDGTTHILYPAVKALLQLAGDFVTFKNLFFMVCLKDHYTLKTWSGYHAYVMVRIRCDGKGNLRLEEGWEVSSGDLINDEDWETRGWVDADEKLYEVKWDLVTTVKAALEVRTKARANKSLQYQDLDIILAACKKCCRCLSCQRCLL